MSININPYNPQVLYELGIIEPNTEPDEAYRAWLEEVRDHFEREGTYPHRTAVNFWVVIKMFRNNYSGLLTFHEKVPMMIPKKGHGELVGIATTEEELQTLITPENEEDPKSKYVYLVYKARIPGGDGWRFFLDMLADNHLLEKEMGK